MMERGRGRKGSREERRRGEGEKKAGGGVDEPSERRYIQIRLERVGKTTLSVMVSLSP